MFKFLHKIIFGNGGQGLINDLAGYLDDLPSLRKKVDVFFAGAELFLHLRDDNDVQDFLSGRINISQSTLSYYLKCLLQQVPCLELLSVEIREGYVLCVIDVVKGSYRGLEITLRLENLQFLLEPEKLCLEADLLEFPLVKSKTKPAFFYRCLVLVWKRIAGAEKLYRRMMRNTPALAIKGNTLVVDLMLVPALKDKLTQKLFGIGFLELLSDWIDISRVELKGGAEPKDGHIYIYGGPKIPARLIFKKKAD